MKTIEELKLEVEKESLDEISKEKEYAEKARDVFVKTCIKRGKFNLYNSPGCAFQIYEGYFKKFSDIYNDLNVVYHAKEKRFLLGDTLPYYEISLKE